MRKVFFLIVIFALFSCNENMNNKQSEFSEKITTKSYENNNNQVLSNSLDRELNKYIEEVGGISQPKSMRTIYSICFSEQNKSKGIVAFFSGLNLPEFTDNYSNYGIIGFLIKNGYYVVIFDSKNAPNSNNMYNIGLLEKDSINYFTEDILKRPNSDLKPEIWIYEVLENDSLLLLKKE